jgi:outer membrane protein OmpA-like peptidoglycan-associated protein
MSFGLFGCLKNAPPTVKTSPKVVKKSFEEKQKPVPTTRQGDKSKNSKPALPIVKKGLLKPTRMLPVEFIASNFEMIHFEYDKFRLLPEARKILRNNAELINNNLQKQKDFKILIEGHSDERGTNEYNLALGERRALRARDYLISLGISTDILYTKSWGEEKPIYSDRTEEAWQNNRRAEFHEKLQ